MSMSETLLVSGAGKQLIHSAYVDLMKQRAKNILPEMGCAKKLCEIISGKLENGLDLKKGISVVDVGCATGHYFNSFSNADILLKKYIGIEVDNDMFSAAQEIWAQKIADGQIQFILSDIEDDLDIPFSDIIFCFNSFMYYRSGLNVLKKLLEKCNYLIVRSYFAEENFRILRGQSEQNNDSVSVEESNIFSENGDLLSADFWTIYSFSYIEQIVSILAPNSKLSWIDDDDYGKSLAEENEAGVNKRGATQIIGGLEISYPLLQPWKILLIENIK